MSAPRKVPLSAWLRYRFEDPSWLVLAAGAILAVSLGVLGWPSGKDRVLNGEVVDFTIHGKGAGRAVVRFASGDTRLVSLPYSPVCAVGDRLRVFETPRLIGASFAAAPEGCVHAPR